MYATINAEDICTDKGEMERALCVPVKGVRVIIHYNTGIPLPEPSDAETFLGLLQYHGPVGKGGFALQLCGCNRSL